MAAFVLIDNKKLQIIKGAKSMRQLEVWAEILLPKTDFLIIDCNFRRSFSVFDIAELALMYGTTTGKRVPPGDYPATITLLHNIAKEFPDDATPWADLVRKLGREPVQTALPAERTREPNPEKNPELRAPPAPRVEKIAKEASASPSAGKRPKGGITGRVWEIADTEAGKGGTGKELRGRIVAACIADGIDPSTAATQYSRWNKGR